MTMPASLAEDAHREGVRAGTPTESHPGVPVPMPRRRSGVGVAWFGFWVGILMSIAGNVKHQYVKQPEGHSPDMWGVVLGGAWPVLLVIALEVISRIDWPEGLKWRVIRFGGTGVVAAVAAIMSYRHLHGLITVYEGDPLSALIGPLAIDGLMAVCSAGLIASKISGRKDPSVVPVPGPVPHPRVPAQRAARPSQRPLRQIRRRRVAPTSPAPAGRRWTSEALVTAAAHLEASQPGITQVDVASQLGTTAGNIRRARRAITLKEGNLDA